jgi:hypothetical protein
MDRRTFLRATVAFASFPVLNSFGQGIQTAQVNLGSVIKAYKSQNCPAWCWAASISMLFRLYGHPIDQTAIAKVVYGPNPPCKTAQPSAILKLLNRRWTDDNGDDFSCRTTSLYDSFAEIDNFTPQNAVDNLTNGDAMLLCTTHHCMVLTGIQYINTSAGPNIVVMGVADPWPSSSGLRNLAVPEGRKITGGGQMTILATVDVN